MKVSDFVAFLLLCIILLKNTWDSLFLTEVTVAVVKPSSDDNNTMDEHNYDRPDLTPHDVALTDPDHFLYRL